MPLKFNIKQEAWFYVGVIGYVFSIFSNGLIGAIFGEQSPLGTAYILLNALSGGIIYFFIFASIGYLLQKRRLDKIWIWATVVFYLFTVIYAGVKLGLPDKPLLILAFPLLYGAYFPIFGINYLTERVADDVTPLSVLLAFLYNLATVSWFYLEFFGKKFKTAKYSNIIRTILLAIIFAVLAIGMISCVNEISSSSF